MTKHTKRFHKDDDITDTRSQRHDVYLIRPMSLQVLCTMQS